MTYNEYYEKNISPERKAEIAKDVRKLDRKMMRRQAIKGIGDNIKILFDNLIYSEKKYQRQK
jgi:hypothetical protein